MSETVQVTPEMKARAKDMAREVATQNLKKNRGELLQTMTYKCYRSVT